MWWAERSSASSSNAYRQNSYNFLLVHIPKSRTHTHTHACIHTQHKRCCNMCYHCAIISFIHRCLKWTVTEKRILFVNANRTREKSAKRELCVCAFISLNKINEFDNWVYEMFNQCIRIWWVLRSRHGDVCRSNTLHFHNKCRIETRWIRSFSVSIDKNAFSVLFTLVWNVMNNVLHLYMPRMPPELFIWLNMIQLQSRGPLEH